MSKDYEEFVKYVFHEHIEKRLSRIRRDWGHHLDREYFLASLLRATRNVRFIRDYAERDEDIRESFMPEFLKGTVRQIRYGVEMNNRFTVDTGIADVIQDYFGEIVDGIDVDYFPKEDMDVLQQSGSTDPRRDITAFVYLIKSRKEQFLRDGKEVRFSGVLVETVKRIERIEMSLPEEPPTPNEPATKQPTVKCAIFKGLGSIAQGTLMTATNLTLAAGLWSIPLPVETTSLGAVVSATTGIGTILTGIGELRGE